MTTVELVRSTPAKARLEIVDCDIHPTASVTDIKRFIAPEWHAHIDSFGFRHRQPFINDQVYPRASPQLARRDAFPPGGGAPGSSLPFMQEQLLDPCGITFGILQPLSPNGMDQPNLRFGAAVCRALNDWSVAEWTDRDARLRTSIMVPQEDAEAAVAEVRRKADDKAFVQVSIAQRSQEPVGRRRYWPIYRAAVEAGLPLGIHTGGYNGRPPTPGSGWASFLAEQHHLTQINMQSLVTSLVMEGVFEEFPELKVCLYEGGLVWLPALCWRLDSLWARLKSEVPHLRRPPSEYIREHFWLSTQPMDEAEKPEQLRRTFEWIGFDRILFATDYPHWDFDDPRYAIPMKMSDAERRLVFSENARGVFRI